MDTSFSVDCPTHINAVCEKTIPFLSPLELTQADSQTSEVIRGPLEGGKQRDRTRPQTSEKSESGCTSVWTLTQMLTVLTTSQS